ncbi:MAG TPA: hypothetical protein VEW74_03540 [Candidatus Nitrosotalea sp.]|nr:hypothetical protein [Candidatus Nitrosotalea sp.]
MKLGACVLGAAAIGTGIVNLVYGAFDPAEEPIQAWVNNVPHGFFPDVVAVLLVFGGAAILTRRGLLAGSAALALVYFLFAVFAAPRLVTAPQYLGWQAVFGAAVGVTQNLIIVAAAAVLYASVASSPRSGALVEIARWIFGISSITFGLGHFTGIASVAAMVPKWMPFGGKVWAIATGVAFVLAGVAILARVRDVLAAQLLALMLLVFSALALAPMLFNAPHEHAAWGVNLYNLAAAGAALVLAGRLANRE